MGEGRTRPCVLPNQYRTLGLVFYSKRWLIAKLIFDTTQNLKKTISYGKWIRRVVDMRWNRSYYCWTKKLALMFSMTGIRLCVTSVDSISVSEAGNTRCCKISKSSPENSDRTSHLLLVGIPIDCHTFVFKQKKRGEQQNMRLKCKTRKRKERRATKHAI